MVVQSLREDRRCLLRLRVQDVGDLSRDKVDLQEAQCAFRSRTRRPQDLGLRV